MLLQSGLIGFDTETYLITKKDQAPRLVCGAFFTQDEQSVLLNALDTIKELRDLLSNPKVTLISHNAKYDFSVVCKYDQSIIPLVFKAYEEGRILDTILYEKLILLADSGDIDSQKYSLAAAVHRHLGIDIEESKKSEDSWRLRYSELDGIPINKWPEDAAKYAKDDAAYHLKLFSALYELNDQVIFKDLARQSRADFALGLMTCCGFSIDMSAVADLSNFLEQETSSRIPALQAAGIYRQEKKGLVKNTKELQARVLLAFDIKAENPPPTTPSGKISIDSAALAYVAGIDPMLDLLVEFNHYNGIKDKFLTMLLESEGSLSPRYDCLKTTGRASSFQPNIQQMPRAGGIRECFIPHKGYVFLSIDYSTLELCTLAYATKQLLKIPDRELKMWTAINEGKDLHLVTASHILHREYEDLVRNKKSKEVADARQLSKSVNFGYPGGLGAQTFVEYAKATYGVTVTVDEARELKSKWLAAYPEMDAYFRHINSLEDEAVGGYRVAQLNTDRIRAGCTFTAACNSYFQGLAADGSKLALFNCSKAAYTDESSPCYGSALVAFIHDEIIFEIPEKGGPPAWTAISREFEKIMIESMQQVMPGIRVSVEPSLMNRWYKKASPVYDSAGNMLIWEPAGVSN